MKSAALALIALFVPTASAAQTDGLFQRLRLAACDAVQSPATWVPLAGAALAGPFDRRIAHWAQAHHPVFGDTDDAGERSDDLRDGLIVAAGLSALISPPPPDETWFDYKARTGLALVLTGQGARGASGLIKGLTDRERPDGSNEHSFPSGHSTGAFAMASFADAELRRFDLPDAVQLAASGGLYSSAALTGWARVEADKHWASDVLAGAALGNFLARFVHAAVLDDDDAAVSVVLVPGGDWSLRLAWSLRS